MSDKSAIEWTDATWNPVTGCTKVSPGCDHCYAETFAERWRGTPGHHFENGFDVTLRPERLDQPLKWRKPRRVFVNSMSDLFHDAVPTEYIVRVFAMMALAERHTFQVLTKRHGRMRALLTASDWTCRVDDAAAELAEDHDLPISHVFPLPNLWLGVSVEDQRRADLRIPALLETPAAVRFLSAEPLLGPIDLSDWMADQKWPSCWDDHSPTSECGRCIRPDWVIVGGESGPGARPMRPDWARSLRDQCQAAGVPFFFKQWGEYVPAAVEDAPTFVGGRAYNSPLGGRSAATIRSRGITRPMQPGDATKRAVMLDTDTIAVRVGKKKAGRELDGRTWDEFPTAVPQ